MGPADPPAPDAAAGQGFSPLAGTFLYGEPMGRMTEAQFRKIVGNARANELLNPKPAATGPAPYLELPVKWELPMPPSVNSLYVSTTDRRTGRKKRVLSEQAREYRKVVKGIVGGRIDPDALYTLRIVLFYPWYFKNGKLNKFDETNRLKLLEDCIVHALGVDDSHFKRPDCDSVDTTRKGRIQAVRVYLLPLRASSESGVDF